MLLARPAQRRRRRFGLAGRDQRRWPAAPKSLLRRGSAGPALRSASRLPGRRPRASAWPSPRSCRARSAADVREHLGGAWRSAWSPRTWSRCAPWRAPSRWRNPSACSRRCSRSPTWPAPTWKWPTCCAASTPSSAGLMYAENFYIVLYDDVRDSLRFLYFADQRDTYVAEPERDIADRRHAQQPDRRAAAPRRAAAGAVGADPRTPGRRPRRHATVPTARTGWACRCAATTASAARSWCRATTARDVYGDEERALLAFVAQHILTALDRFHAREELERRVEERTQALQLSNRDLQAEIIERQRAERLQRALFRIAELSITSETLERFYTQVHDVVSDLLYARNFYIALLSDDGERPGVPVLDRRARRRRARRRKLATGLTEYVIARGRAAAGRPQAHRRAGVAGPGAQPRFAGALLARRAAVPRRVGGRRDHRAELFAGDQLQRPRPGAADLRRPPHQHRPGAQAGAGPPGVRARRAGAARRLAHARAGRRPMPSCWRRSASACASSSS